MKLKILETMTDEESLGSLVNIFGVAQKQKLEEKRLEGWSGWDVAEDVKEDLLQRIIDNLLLGDWVDVANLSMFAWNFNLKPRQCL